MERTYTVRHCFDVWGNAEEGWDVNNICTLGEIKLDFDDNTTDEELLGKILESVVPWFNIEALLEDESPHLDPTCCGGDVFFVNLGDTDKPWLQLFKEG